MAREMQTKYRMHLPVPIVAYNSTVDVTKTALFSFEGSTDTLLSLAV
jgi:hypothetical protein